VHGALRVTGSQEVTPYRWLGFPYLPWHHDGQVHESTGIRNVLHFHIPEDFLHAADTGGIAPPHQNANLRRGGVLQTRGCVAPIAIVPGWHTTIFPPYFVAGAIYSGFAMVLTLAIPLRAAYGLQDFITERHLQNMAKIMLATGLIVAYGYFMELFTSWYSGNDFEMYITQNRLLGPYAPAYWALLLCNVIVPQALWSNRVRANPILLFVIAIIVNIGMWLERFVIVVTSLHRDFLPSSWGNYLPTVWDAATFAGTLGLFLSLVFLFIRFLPMISIFEMRTLLPEAEIKKD
jgi:molybdopterin-containing oxidoreductase family membrane subunit